MDEIITRILKWSSVLITKYLPFLEKQYQFLIDYYISGVDRNELDQFYLVIQI